jgi:hypothetical protein
MPPGDYRYCACSRLYSPWSRSAVRRARYAHVAVARGNFRCAPSCSDEFQGWIFATGPFSFSRRDGRLSFRACRPAAVICPILFASPTCPKSPIGPHGLPRLGQELFCHSFCFKERPSNRFDLMGLFNPGQEIFPVACGLCGDEKSSADKVTRTPLSKQRNKHIQRVLVEAAKLAPRQDHNLALVYEREKQKGMPIGRR